MVSQPLKGVCQSFLMARSSSSRRRRIVALAAVSALAVVALPAHRGSADDETADTEIRIEAPLEAVNCSVNPATITVLGLTIDVSAARFEVQPTPVPTPAASSGEDAHRGHGNSASSNPRPVGCYYYCAAPVPVAPGCTALVPGQAVEVKLRRDSAPLVATEVKQDGAQSQGPEIVAALQNVDASARTIEVLGLSVDVSHADLLGNADDSSDDNRQPIDLTELLMGQFVEVKLSSGSAALVATELEVRNFSNQIEVDLVDTHGNRVDDVDDDGRPVADIKVKVIETVVVQNPTSVTVPVVAKKVIEFRTVSNGRFALTGLPTGRAKIFVARDSGGVTSTGRRAVSVHADRIRSLRVRLLPVRAR